MFILCLSRMCPISQVEVSQGELVEYARAKSGITHEALLREFSRFSISILLHISLSKHYLFVFVAASARQVDRNLPSHIMHAPIFGPVDPNDSSNIPNGMQNHWCGQAEDAHLNSYTFDDQYHTYMKTGKALDPSTGLHVEGKGSGGPDGEAVVKKATKRQKVHTDGPRLLDRPFTLRSRQPWAEKESQVTEELTEEQRDYAKLLEIEKSEKAALLGKEDVSIFHGKQAEDYQGRSWVEGPAGFRQDAGEKCFLPKRVIHTWTGHNKGVNAIHFFPNSGHLLLSAGLDGKAKIWSTMGSRECMRTYLGHSKGIRDCWFADSGKKFVTAAYDKKIKLWDTETGAMLQSFGDNKAMAYTVRTHPGPEHSDVLLAGLQNKKIVQFDMRSGDSVQEYDYHLGPVNSITFIDNNRRFLSTSGASYPVH